MVAVLVFKRRLDDQEDPRDWGGGGGGSAPCCGLHNLWGLLSHMSKAIAQALQGWYSGAWSSTLGLKAQLRRLQQNRHAQGANLLLRQHELSLRGATKSVLVQLTQL
eukprot:6054004-Amphidinium_carterae.1